MGLFDFDIDYIGDDVFDAEPEPVTAMTAKEKAVFSVYAGADLLARGVQLPGPGEALRMISYMKRTHGGTTKRLTLWWRA
jgi:hypothetical protein